MVSAIDRFPDVFLRSRDEREIALKTRSSIQSVVLMGMGGSASAADVVLDWLKEALPVPALVHREPGLPAFVNAGTLFIAMSYSGETSETLVAFQAAKNRGSALIGIGHGGSLASLCNRFKAPFFQVEASLAPRAALGQLVVAAAVALESANLVRSTTRERSIAARELVRIRRRCRVETPRVNNPAKSLAEKLVGLLLDYVSLYLAMLRRIDPTPTDLINEYKKR